MSVPPIVKPSSVNCELHGGAPVLPEHPTPSGTVATVSVADQ